MPATSRQILDDKGQLTDKQAAFVTAYYETGYNATKAAIKAGYSPHTAQEIGSENLSKPMIRAALEERAKTLGLNESGIFAELAGIAVGLDMADFEDMLESGMSLSEIRDAGVDTRNIKEITVKRTPGTKTQEPSETVKLRLHDRHVALRDCGRALMMFGDKRDVRVTTEHRQASDQEVMDTMQVIIERAKARGLERSQKLLE